VAVVSALPRADRSARRAAIVDGLLSALLLAILVYLKATIAVAACAVIGLGGLMIRQRSETVTFLTVAVVGTAALVLGFGYSTGIFEPYVTDLLRAAQAQGGRAGDAIMLGYILSADFLLVCLIALGTAQLAQRQVTVRPALFLLGLIGATFLLVVQNHPANEVPMVPVLGMIAYLLFRGSGDELPSPRSNLWHAALLAGITFLFVRPIVPELRSLLHEITAPAGAGADVDWLKDTPLRDLRLGAMPNPMRDRRQCKRGDAGSEMSNDREYLSVHHDGVQLLERHGAAQARVLSLTWTDPFPTLVGHHPTEHEVSWWDPGRSFSDRIHPAPDTLLSEVDFVLVPKFNWGWFNRSPEAMLQIYGPAIRRDFRPIERTGCWELWKRSRPAAVSR